MEDSTTYSSPRNRDMVRALAGDSTTIRAFDTISSLLPRAFHPGSAKMGWPGAQDVQRLYTPLYFYSTGEFMDRLALRTINGSANGSKNPHSNSTIMPGT